MQNPPRHRSKNKNMMNLNQKKKKKEFAHRKTQCLDGTKKDKSSAGQIDERCIEICQVINALPHYYTTSSCSGRCFLYRGPGIKATNQFQRYRVSHNRIQNAHRYFDLSTLQSDPTGGGDEPLIHRQDTNNGATTTTNSGHQETPEITDAAGASPPSPTPPQNNSLVWLRFEPFILHVACQSLSAARTLVDAARPSFKNVGLTSWNANEHKFVVAVWGDEGLDLPLMAEAATSNENDDSDGSSGGSTTIPTDLTTLLGKQWLADQCNARHERNWTKLNRFVDAVRALSSVIDEEGDEDNNNNDDDDDDDDGCDSDVDNQPFLHTDDTPTTLDDRRNTSKVRPPRSFDVIGDVALLHGLPLLDLSEHERHNIGASILHTNKAIQIVACRHSALVGTERAAGEQGLSILAGPDRDPLITTHCERGIKCVVDVRRTFFSPRMSGERRRLCDLVLEGERILVPFAGVALEALQLVALTRAFEVVAIERNPVAIQCAHRAHQLLERNAMLSDGRAAASRLRIVHGDVLDVVPTLPHHYYDRIVCPRPKDGAMDGDLGDGSGGERFLDAILPVLKRDGGVLHWYDFCADVELPVCARSCTALMEAGIRHKLCVEVLRVTKAGSVAMRQYRVCVDVRVRPLEIAEA